MSSTNKTATIELSQYVGTDKPTYLVDYNGDMLKIDNAIAADRDSIQTAQGKADEADSKADTNTGAISNLNDQINTPTTGLAAVVNQHTGHLNTIDSLIGNGEPTTQDKTIIGAINELAAEIPSGETTAANVSYDNTTSGLTADDVQEAIDELVAAIPTAGDVELAHGTLTAGQTSLTLTFSDVTIGANTLVDIYAPDGVAPVSKSETSSTIVLTFTAQASDIVVYVRATNV